MKGERDDETVLNAQFILADIMEQKKFVTLMGKRHNLEKLSNIAFSADAEAREDARATTLVLLTKFVHFFGENQKKDNSDDDFMNPAEDDDMIVNEMSDDDGEEGKASALSAIHDFLADTVANLAAIFTNSPGEPVSSAFNQRKMAPVGVLKLRAVELLSQIVSMRKEKVCQALSDSSVLKALVKMCEQHPWSNMFQLKVHAIFEDVLEAPVPA